MRFGRGKASDVEALAHLLARLEIGDALGVDVDRIPGARVAALAGVAVAGREGAEAPQLDSAAGLQLIDHGFEESGYDPLDLLTREIGMVVAQLLHQLGTDHGSPRHKGNS